MGLISRVSSRTYSFRARAKKVPKVAQESISTTFLLGSFQRVLLSKMGKSHSRPEQLSNNNNNHHANANGSNLTSSKHHSASKNSIVSESEIKIQQNGSRLASNTSQQTIKEAATPTCETTQAITNNANVNTQLPNDLGTQPVAISATAQNNNNQHR